MDLETLSNRILNGDQFDDQNDNALSHHGVKGMKWGVRKDRKTSGKKKSSSSTKSNEKLTSLLLGKNRRYEGETAAQYQARMKRESEERIAKANVRAQAKSEKRALKSQEKIAKMQIKEAKRQADQEASRKANEEKNREGKTTKVNTKNSVKTMSDQEIRDAIARFRLEQDYKNEQKKANNATRGIGKKTIVSAAAIGGGILLAVGKSVATKQLTEVGNQKVDKYLVGKGWKIPENKKGVSEARVIEIVKEVLKERD